jgi:hypothetical protein
MSPISPRYRHSIASAAAALVVASLLAATGGPAAATPPKAPPPTPRILALPGPFGMVVAIEPETGSLVMPTPEQMRLLTPAEEAGLLRTSEGLVETRRADGTVMVDLQGRFMEYLVLRLGLLGLPSVSCLDDRGALLRALDPCAPPPTPLLEER